MAHPTVAPYGAFVSADGYTLLISIQNDREWRSFASRVLRDDSLLVDARFATNGDRVLNRPQLDARIQDWFGSMQRMAIVAALLDAQIAFGTVNDVGGLSAHPQLRRVQIESAYGSIRMPAHPMRAASWPEYGAIPELGEHTGAIRSEFGDVK